MAFSGRTVCYLTSSTLSSFRETLLPDIKTRDARYHCLQLLTPSDFEGTFTCNVTYLSLKPLGPVNTSSSFLAHLDSSISDLLYIFGLRGRL